MSGHELCWAFWYKRRGLHVHMRVSCGPVGTTRAKCGDLVMHADEFDRFKAALLQVSKGCDWFEFIEEDVNW